MAAFPGGTPDAALLDPVTDGRPAYLTNRDGHGAWVNHAALALAGIDRDTPDPPDGRIERDSQGNPTGTLHEGAMRLVARHVPPPTAETLVEALRLAQRHLHALGITAWQDAIVGPASEAFPDANVVQFSVYAELGAFTEPQLVQLRDTRRGFAFASQRGRAGYHLLVAGRSDEDILAVVGKLGDVDTLSEPGLLVSID